MIVISLNVICINYVFLITISFPVSMLYKYVCNSSSLVLIFEQIRQ